MGYTPPTNDVDMLLELYASTSFEIAAEAGREPSDTFRELNPDDGEFASKMWQGEGRYQQVWKADDTSVVLAIVPHLFIDRPEAIETKKLSLVLGFTGLDPRCGKPTPKAGE